MKSISKTIEVTCPCEKHEKVKKVIEVNDGPQANTKVKRRELDVFCPHCGKYFKAVLEDDLAKKETLRITVHKKKDQA
ncbi:MAG: hypothetical protein AAFV78_06470 [Bacteroidota bacterium]